LIDTFSSIPSLCHVREVRTPLYRIAEFRATVDAARAAPEIIESDEVVLPSPAVAAHIVWKERPATPDGVSAPARSGERLGERARVSPPRRRLHLPILMYHQVAPSNSAEQARTRVTPAMFERQLRYLRECGFASVTLLDWQEMLEGRRPMAERPVIITFDDGYADFAEHAWPILRSNDFGAMLMVVTGRVGGTNSWDQGREGTRLLDWESIARLQKDGVEIGAHSVTHRRMTALTPTEMAREAFESRAAIERCLHAPVLSFAYPFGDEDEVVRHIVGAAGFTYGLSCRPGLSARTDPWLALPRIEVTGFDDLPTFIGKLAP
jgi:peptidoglycan/xylan/chitin deacetylase (PgdA/CDA1 family)